jgi:hypothetical protein
MTRIALQVYRDLTRKIKINKERDEQYLKNNKVKKKTNQRYYDLLYPTRKD